MNAVKQRGLARGTLAARRRALLGLGMLLLIATVTDAHFRHPTAGGEAFGDGLLYGLGVTLLLASAVTGARRRKRR